MVNLGKVGQLPGRTLHPLKGPKLEFEDRPDAAYQRIPTVLMLTSSSRALRDILIDSSGDVVCFNTDIHY